MFGIGLHRFDDVAVLVRRRSAAADKQHGDHPYGKLLQAHANDLLRCEDQEGIMARRTVIRRCADQIHAAV